MQCKYSIDFPKQIVYTAPAMKKAPETTVILSSRLQSQTGRDSFTQSAIEIFLKNIGIATLTAWPKRTVKKPGADKAGTKPPVMILGTR